MLRLVTSDSEAKVQSHRELNIFRKIYLLLDLQPAPPVGFNLTFVCPEGEVRKTFSDLLKISTQVFNHDWFATPFVLTTCQPNGVFDPPDWEIFDCVIRE